MRDNFNYLHNKELAHFRSAVTYLLKSSNNACSGWTANRSVPKNKILQGGLNSLILVENARTKIFIPKLKVKIVDGHSPASGAIFFCPDWMPNWGREPTTVRLDIEYESLVRLDIEYEFSPRSLGEQAGAIWSCFFGLLYRNSILFTSWSVLAFRKLVQDYDPNQF